MYECCVCGSENIEDISHFFKHKISENENHYMCLVCIVEFSKICTCDKEFRQEPKSLMIYCPCFAGQEPTKMYFGLDNPYFLKLLDPIKSNNNLFYINGCRGCKYTDKEICENLNIALKSAVEACIYEKKDQGQLCSMSYLSDALESEFIDYANKIGLNLGQVEDL